MSRHCLFASCCVLLLLAGCKNSGNTPPAQNSGNKPAASAVAPATKVTPEPASSSAESKGTAPAAEAPAQAGGNIRGKVLETMNAAGYTYLFVESAGGSLWVAIPETEVAVGQEVDCLPGMVMTKFHSQSLQRDFDSIIFSAGLAGSAKPFNPHAAPAKTAAAASAHQGGTFAEALQQESGHKKANPDAKAMEMMGSAGSMGAVVPFAELKVDKAGGANALTVGEAFSRAQELGKQKVRVRGKVVKLSRMIMGKNWVHLQDGTGDPLNNSHDLVFTTMAEPEQGQIVTLEGTLEVGKDFGYGYKYAILVEDALVVGQ